MANLIKAGGYAGIISPIIFAIFLAAAVYNYPSYNPTTNFLSDLGIGPSAVFFNSGVIIAGLLGILFSLALYKKFNSKISRAGSILLVIGNIFLILVGIFSEQYGILHTIISTLFFLFIILSLLFIGAGSVKAKTGYGAFIAGLFIIGIFAFGINPIQEYLAVGTILVWSFAMGIHLLRL